MGAVQLFHYHLVTSRVREVEARYSASSASISSRATGASARSSRPLSRACRGRSSTRGFKLRLTELEKGAVNVVVQPGQWPLPRVDHLGLVLDEDEFETTLDARDGTTCACRSTAAGGRSSPRTPATGSSSIRRANGSTSCSRKATSSGSRAAPESRRPVGARRMRSRDILDAERDGAERRGR